MIFIKTYKGRFFKILFKKKQFINLKASKTLNNFRDILSLSIVSRPVRLTTPDKGIICVDYDHNFKISDEFFKKHWRCLSVLELESLFLKYYFEKELLKMHVSWSHVKVQ